MAAGDKPVDQTGVFVISQDQELGSIAVKLRVAYQTSPSYKYLNLTVQKDVTGTAEDLLNVDKTYHVTIEEE